SNADGSVQYIEFFTDTNSEEFLSGRTLQSDANTFVFPNDLPIETANRHFLVATPAFASQCDQPFAPDYTFTTQTFHSLVADTLVFEAVGCVTMPCDTFAYTSGELPTDGYYALHEAFGDTTGTTRTEAANSPTNFAGQVCLPEPSGWRMQAAGLAGVLGLARWRRRRAH
ncbi:MAG: hypothetical protein ACRDIC_17110, partial [bacterium]